MARLLLDHGADKSLSDQWDRQALAYALPSGPNDPIAAMLVGEYGARVGLEFAVGRLEGAMALNFDLKRPTFGSVLHRGRTCATWPTSVAPFGGGRCRYPS